MKVSDLLVAALEREGVEYVFGLPGEENEDVLFSLRDADVTFVPVRHEQGAAFMADVWGRLTGDAGVCLATLGPGATNLLTGVADAHLDKSPVVAITGQGGLERLHHESHQAVDVVRIFQPVTKWNTQLDDPDIVHESVRKAFKLAEREKPGATHVELPEDVAAADTERRPMAASPAGKSRATDEAVSRAEEVLAAADRPLLVAGNGAVRSGAADALREFVAALDVPVVSTYMGKGAVSDADPRSLMTLTSGPEGTMAEVFERTDCVLAVGYDVAEHDPGDWYRGESSDLVHLDSEPAEVYDSYQPTVELVGDIPSTLRAMTERLSGVHGAESGWWDGYRADVVGSVEPGVGDSGGAGARSHDATDAGDRNQGATDAGDRNHDRVPADSEEPFSVRGVLPVLREVLGPEDVVVSDVGQHKMAIAEAYPTYEPNTCIVSNGMASMGIAVPGAVAADLAVEEHVVAATGDGGFLMNAAEIETATRLDCGFTIVVFNDDDYRLISEKQREHRDEFFGTELTNPDLVTFAESFGVDGYRPTSAAELEDALATATDDAMSLVEVPVE